MSIALSLSTTLRTSFDDAVARTRKALADQGFGVLTEINVKATPKAKLGAEVNDYLILGACNPPLAHRAVSIDPQIGLLLPCNVVVRAEPAAEGTVIVEAINPQMLVDLTGEPALQEVAEQASAKLRAAIDGLAATPTPATAP